jgi:hypothetical protein
VHPTADRDHVGVVVLTRQGCRLGAPHQRCTNAVDLVGRDLLAVAGAADHHTETARVGNHCSRGPEAEDRVVVDGVVNERAVIDGFVAVLLEPAEQVFLQLEAGMVRSQMHAHGVTLTGAG